MNQAWYSNFGDAVSYTLYFDVQGETVYTMSDQEKENQARLYRSDTPGKMIFSQIC